MNSVKLSIYFEEPFWIAVIENQTHHTLQVARHVFGPEPTDPEVFQWLLSAYSRLLFNAAGQSQGALAQSAQNYKRRMREVKKALSRPLVGTHSQRILQQEYEQNKEKRQVRSKLEQEAELERKFQLRQEKRKAKHRGH